MHLSDIENKWDRLLKIHTSGRDDSEADTFNYPYEPTPYAVLIRLSESGYIRKKDVLIDYGAGKGRVSFFLASETKCKCIGVEISERLWERAEMNRQTASSGKRTEFIRTDARDYRIGPDVNRFFFFNPFSEEIFKSVLSRITESYYEAPRELILFFYFPSNEYVACLMNTPELMFIDEIDCSDLFEEAKDRERILVFGTEC